MSADAIRQRLERGDTLYTGTVYPTHKIMGVDAGLLFDSVRLEGAISGARTTHKLWPGETMKVLIV